MNKVRFRDVVVFVCRLWRRVPWLVAGAFGTMLAATLCDVFIPVVAGNLIDALTVEAVSAAERWSAALGALAAFVGLSAGFYALREVSYRFWIPLATRVMRRIVADAFWRVQRFGAEWHANSFAGATVRKISRGMWAYDDFAETIYVGFLPAAVVLVGVTTNLFLRWPMMGLFVVAAILVYCSVSVALVMGYVAPATRRMNEADSAVGAAMADAITCNAAVKGFGAERREERRFGGVTRTWAGLARGAWTRRSTSAPSSHSSPWACRPACWAWRSGSGPRAGPVPATSPSS